MFLAVFILYHQIEKSNIMKKLLMYLSVGALSTSAFSQSDSKDRLPKAGDYGLGIDGVPVVD